MKVYGEEPNCPECSKLSESSWYDKQNDLMHSKCSNGHKWSNYPLKLDTELKLELAGLKIKIKALEKQIYDLKNT
jgi:hypothetical protein